MQPKYKSGHSAWEENIPFAFNLVSTLKPAIIVELGVHYGDSYFAFCQAVKEYNTQTSCMGIDLFEGDDLTGYYGEEVFQKVYKYNLDNYHDFSVIIRESFDVQSSQIIDNTIDILHIDGSHYYNDVKHDFETWLTKVREDGVILIHDTNVFKEPYGVWKFWKEIKDKYLSFEFKNKYGLGVISLDKEHPQMFTKLFEEAQRVQKLQKSSGLYRP
jgi:hypothetical protein